MRGIDLVMILTLIVLASFAAWFYLRRRKRCGSCCGGCEGCKQTKTCDLDKKSTK